MEKQRISRRKEQAVETRARLYETADRLFAERGIDETSVDAIVEAAGVSKGTFYVYFVSKDALAASLISEYVEKVDMDYKAFLQSLSPDMPSANILLSLVEEIFGVIADKIGYERMRILYRVQLTDAAYAQAVTSYNRALYLMLGEVLESGVRRGEFIALLPVDEIARHIMLAMRGLTYEWCIRYPDFDLKKQARAHFELLLAGIAEKHS